MHRRRLVVLMLLASALPAAGATYEGRVVAVTSGHDLVVLVQSRRVAVRLAGIAAPLGREPYAIASRQSLIAVCGGEPARLESLGVSRSHAVLAARVACNGVDAAAEQVRRGMARVAPGREPAVAFLDALEGEARAARRGVWARAAAVQGAP